MTLTPLPNSIDATLDLLAKADYIADRSLATVLYLALKMGRPLFLEGEAGVGKTEIAKVLSQALGRRLIRLQCYEGLDISSAVYEWNYGAQMIAIRLAEARRRGRPRAHRARRVLRALPDQAAAAAGARARPGRAAGAADRRDRPHRRGLRGVPAGSAGRFPDHRARARHRQGGAAADRAGHLQPHPRGARRAQAPVPLSLGRLSECRARIENPAHQGAGHFQETVRAGGRLRAGVCARRTCSSRPASPRRWTGPARSPSSTWSRSIRRRCRTRSARC